MNRTLKKASRTMIANSGRSKRFWVERVNTTRYTQNRSMINKKHNNTPYEICNCNIPDVSYFKVFGRKCFLHNNGKTHLTTFDAKYYASVFLGYSSIRKLIDFLQ